MFKTILQSNAFLKRYDKNVSDQYTLIPTQPVIFM